MLKRFEKVTGSYIETIAGQKRFAFSHSDTADFYDLPERLQYSSYPGSVLRFYDLGTGKVYQPFDKRQDVLYGNPVFLEGKYYFLQGDFSCNVIRLYQWVPDSCLQQVTELSIKEVNLYNLHIIGDSVHIVSQDEQFVCYYPQKFSFPLGSSESAIRIEEDTVYLETWVEEGWDSEKNCATDRYRYYDKLITRDFDGNLLSEEVGSLYQAPDGSWWIG